MKTEDLASLSNDVRKDIIDISYKHGAGHIPSALSMVDYVSVLFSKYYDIQKDKFVVGKPYGSQAYYSTFERLGIVEDDVLANFGKVSKNLTYGITHEHPLVSFADDTLGNALSVACGIAMASKDSRVFVNLSDAVMQAGTIWEAIMFASSNKLNNLVLMIDNNNLQCLGNTSSVVGIEPIDARLDAFGWETHRVQGNSIPSIDFHFKKYFKRKTDIDKPVVFIFDTIKGKGISFMENKEEWHYKTLSENDYISAKKELEV